jgi:restriction system protein
MWRVEISHAGLNKFRVIRGATQEEAELKAAWQRKAWDEQWQHVQLARAQQRKRAVAVRCSGAL